VANYMEARKGFSVYSVFEAPDGMAEPRREPDVVLVCSDSLGRRYRFPIVDVFKSAPGDANPSRAVEAVSPRQLRGRISGSSHVDRSSAPLELLSPRSPGLPSTPWTECPSPATSPRIHRSAGRVLGARQLKAAAGDPLPGGADLYGPLVLAEA
jgi:hypothetical protein